MKIFSRKTHEHDVNFGTRSIHFTDGAADADDDLNDGEKAYLLGLGHRFTAPDEADPPGGEGITASPDPASVSDAQPSGDSSAGTAPDSTGVTS